MKELWKRFVNSPVSYYEVSNLGRIRNAGTGYVLKMQYSYKGYPQISCVTDSGKKTFVVHVLVAKHFVGAKPLAELVLDGDELIEIEYEVNHKDLDKKNNYYKNLEWVLHQDNIDHAHVRGKYRKSAGEASPCSVITWKIVKKAKKLLAKGYSYYSLGRKFGVNSGTIWNAVNGKSWNT